jgi:acyl dehydratase
MVNPDIQGKRYPRTAGYLVGREKVREFARAVMAGPESLDLDYARANGHTDLVVPPTFPVVIQEQSLALVLSDPQSQIDFSRVVHGDQRFIYQRPIVAGDELTSELTVASVKSLGGNHMVSFETSIYDREDQLVCTAVSTLVVRGE